MQIHIKICCSNGTNMKCKSCMLFPFFFVSLKIYQRINIRIVMVGLEIWSNGDRIPRSPKGGDDLSQFTGYRNRYLVSKFPHDNTHLLRLVLFWWKPCFCQNTKTITMHHLHHHHHIITITTITMVTIPRNGVSWCNNFENDSYKNIVCLRNETCFRHNIWL